MPRAFLSHSSRQKGFVELVATSLGKDNVCYDTWTFEEGNKTLEEIYKGLESSDLFVLFISETALESDWVKKEIKQAYELIKNDKLKRFLPVLIDDDIKFDDTRIPEWISKNYILRYIAKPTKAAERIRQALKMISWDLYPKIKQIDQLFIGRTEQIRKFEEYIYDYNKPNPICMITTGLQSIGRKKFTKHCLKNSNKIREYYSPPSIFLDSRNSIEDFIIRVYELGYSSKEKSDLFDLMGKTLDEKIALSIYILKELEINEKMLFIIDNDAIVDPTGNITDWFLQIINGIRNADRLFLCMFAKRRLNYHQLRNSDYIFSIELPELEKYERNALFKSLLDIGEIQINKNDFETICELFNGFPEQIFYAYNIIINDGLPYLLERLHLITDFSSEKISSIIQKYESRKLALVILKFLSEFEFISINLLSDILDNEIETLKTLLTDFSNDFILEYIGATREYIRLNDAIKDYIQRLNLNLDTELMNKLDSQIKLKFSKDESSDYDLSDYSIYLKEALKNNIEVNSKLLIPSHFVNAMRELYNYEKRYNDVIKLADRVLLQDKFLDAKITREIRYWLCLALARKREKRFLNEVQKIDGPDHNFLLGFYYRLTNKYERGIEKLKEVLDDYPYFKRAKRELVQIYIAIEAYDLALPLAKENYEIDKNNIYNLQSYFRCLIKKHSPNDTKMIKQLLDGIQSNPHKKAKEIYHTSSAQYFAYIDNNLLKAIDILNDAIQIFPDIIYPYLTKLEICQAYGQWDKINDTLKIIEHNFKSDADIFTRLTYLTSKFILYQKSSNSFEAKNILETKIKLHFPDYVYQRIKNEFPDINT